MVKTDVQWSMFYTELLQKPKYILKIPAHAKGLRGRAVLPASSQKLIFISSFHRHMVA